MTKCTHTNKEIRLEWVDRRLPFLRSFSEEEMCFGCADDLEADEFVEIVGTHAIVPHTKAVVDEIMGFVLMRGK